MALPPNSLRCNGFGGLRMLTNKQFTPVVTPLHKAVRVKGMSADTDAVHPLRRSAVHRGHVQHSIDHSDDLIDSAGWTGPLNAGLLKLVKAPADREEQLP